MGLEGVKTGDPIYVVPYARSVGQTYRVTSIGRKWVHVGLDAYGLDSGADRSGSGDRAYRSEAEFRERRRIQDAWSDLDARIGVRPPAGMTLETIQQVRALLGLPAWEG